MQLTIPADAGNQKQILTLIEEMGYKLPCNCHGKHRCPGMQYSFDCARIPKEPVTVTLPDSGSPIHGIALENRPLSIGQADTLLVDLGTTTVALVLMDSQTGELRQTHVFPNPQISLGADVISRIHASLNGEGETLTKRIRETLSAQTTLLCRKNNQSKQTLTRALIGGNTTMIHLLMGYSCAPLSSSPFIPEHPVPAEFTYQQTRIQISPWLSAFIGGDITAGIKACHLDTDKKTALLIDLGTNGEMVLSHNNHLYTAAAAAGPALEGAGLSCGCPAVSGAICQVRLQHRRALCTTIDNKIPTGLCGSGAISLCAELLRHGLLKKNGVLSDDFPSKGIPLGTTVTGSKLFFTADDLRKLQLAIAAIGAGADTLCHEAGISPSSLSSIFLGGGFGFFLPVGDAILLRMLPLLPEERIHALGNTCLQGLYEYAVSGDGTPDITVPYETISLAENTFFKSSFLNHMSYSDDVSSTTYS
jgi:uncharacterized 2Fe-2S/4Fe-4S cluster protein (DUF4445 family)